MNQQEIRDKIRDLVAQYAALADAPKMFIAGETPVNPTRPKDIAHPAPVVSAANA